MKIKLTFHSLQGRSISNVSRGVESLMEAAEWGGSFGDLSVELAALDDLSK